MSTPAQPSPDRGEPDQTRPVHDGGTSPDAAPGPVRTRIEQASRPALERLATLPVWLPFLLLLILLLVGGFLGGAVGWAMVGVAMAFILWLLYLSWPRLNPVERVMRVSVLLLFLAVVITQLVPRG